MASEIKVSEKRQGDNERQVRHLGRRLRQARRARSLTLKHVAAKADCSESLLSKIENDKTTPSLKMLHRIANVLGTSIGHLFGDDHARELTVYRAGERPVVVIAGGDEQGCIRLERLVPHCDDQAIDGNVHVIEPGASNGGNIKHYGQEIGYIIEGRFELHVGNEVHVLKKGDSFFFRSDLPHSYQNVGNRVARVVWVNTPPTF